MTSITLKKGDLLQFRKGSMGISGINSDIGIYNRMSLDGFSGVVIDFGEKYLLTYRTPKNSDYLQVLVDGMIVDVRKIRISSINNVKVNIRLDNGEIVIKENKNDQL